SDGPLLNVSPKQRTTSPTVRYPTKFSAYCTAAEGQRKPSQNLVLNTSCPPGDTTISSCTGAGVISSGRPAPPLVFFHSTSLAFSLRASASPKIRKMPHIPPREAKANPTFEALRRRAIAPTFFASGEGGQWKSCCNAVNRCVSPSISSSRVNSLRRGSNWGRRVYVKRACGAPPG